MNNLKTITINASSKTKEMILREYESVGEIVLNKNPIAFKFEDPVEDARFIFNETDLEEIESEDPSLIVRLSTQYPTTTDSPPAE